MRCVYSIGVTGVSFESAHITISKERGSYGLHGHTYTVEVEICSETLGPRGMVLDVSVLREILSHIVSRLDHKILVGEEQFDSLGDLEEFSRIVVFEGEPQATMEVLAKHVAEAVSDRLIGMWYTWISRICVKMWQGLYEYAVYCRDVGELE